jgi:cobalt-zinc-cadmium efflux system protein
MPDHNRHEHQHNRKAMNLAFWLNTAFSVVEIAGSLYTNSTAILTDAIHDLGDSVAIGMGILFEKKAARKPDARYTYGYKRFSLVSALLLSVLLIGGSVVMVVKSVMSFVHVKEVNSEGMFGLAVLGIVVNGFAFLRMRKSEKQNHNSKAIMLHFMEDILGWVAVLLGSIVIYITGWNWIDGVLSIGIAVFIGWNAIGNMLETIPVFLQSVPRHISINQLKKQLLSVEGVVVIKALHVWALDDDETIGSVKMIYSKGTDPSLLMQKVKDVFDANDVKDTVVQLEPE